jgi:hypothetical protein
MRKYFTYAVAVFFASLTLAVAGANDDAIIANEKAVWQAFKDKKADDFKKLVSADMVAVYADGIMNMPAELEAMKKRDMKSFALSDFKVVMTDANTAMIAYKSKVESMVGGKEDSGTYNCGTVWQMKNGSWQAIFHADMKEEKAAK